MTTSPLPSLQPLKQIDPIWSSLLSSESLCSTWLLLDSPLSLSLLAPPEGKIEVDCPGVVL
eukprot:2322256-Amphidinium_carterae.1